jgi:CII-binding regulator of phage lambda lysogenization HflD
MAYPALSNVSGWNASTTQPIFGATTSNFKAGAEAWFTLSSQLQVQVFNGYSSNLYRYILLFV